MERIARVCESVVSWGEVAALIGLAGCRADERDKSSDTFRDRVGPRRDARRRAAAALNAHFPVQSRYNLTRYANFMDSRLSPRRVYYVLLSLSYLFL